MKKFNLLVLLLPLIALPACSKDRDYYEITFQTKNGEIKGYFPSGTYPTLNGWKYGYQVTAQDTDKYTPALKPVSANATYKYRDCAVTIVGIPYSVDVTKYFAVGETINFSEYAWEYQRYSDSQVTCYSDSTFTYRYKATFRSALDGDGNERDDYSTYFIPGNDITYHGDGSNYPDSRYFVGWEVRNDSYGYYHYSSSDIFETVQTSYFLNIITSDITLDAYYQYY